MEMCQYLMRQEGYVEGTTMVVVLGGGVYEVVGSCQVAGLFGTQQKTLSIPCDNLSFVGQGEGETIVDGGFAVENGRKVSFEGLTMKNTSGIGLFALDAGTEVVLQSVAVKECQYSGVLVRNGAKFDATRCHFHQNGRHGVFVFGSTTTARLTNCTSHHNKNHGVYADSGAVVDLMGEETSVHDNENHGMVACTLPWQHHQRPPTLRSQRHVPRKQRTKYRHGRRRPRSTKRQQEIKKQR